MLDRTICAAGYLPRGGQIIDATLVAAPKQRNTDDEKAAIRAGEIPEEWKDKPARLRRKDRDPSWTVKFAKAKAKDDKEPQIDIATLANMAFNMKRWCWLNGWSVPA